MMTENELRSYIESRVKELNELAAKQEKDSNHEYALKAGAFELLRLAVMFKL